MRYGILGTIRNQIQKSGLTKLRGGVPFRRASPHPLPRENRLLLRQTIKVGFASAEDLDVTEGPVCISGPYGFRADPLF